MLHLVGLDGIKRRVVVFAFFATLVPSLTIGWQSYVVTKSFLTQKIAEELGNAAVYASREVNLWLKERLYEMRVLSASYEVTENVEKVLRTPRDQGKGAEAARRLADYLKSVRAKLPDYDDLMIFAPAGQLLSTSADEVSSFQLPSNWRERTKAEGAIVEQVAWDEAGRRPYLRVAVPIVGAGENVLGVLVAALNFTAVEELLKQSPLRDPGRVYLVIPDGTVVVRAEPAATRPTKARLPTAGVTALFASGNRLAEYENYAGRPAVGTLKPLVHVQLAAVAELPREDTYRQMARNRNLTLLVVGGLLVGVGLIAYGLSLTIVRPLSRLTAGAAKVAGGDLEVDLPVIGRAELGYMSEVFNYMVARLRQSRDALSQKNEELKQLSITDGLTGLYNRKHLGEALGTEVERAHRLRHTFSVLMIDIDHFKRYNDTYGHPAGDQLLVWIAASFKESVRSIDYVARYGGEEFFV
ncbi:MAG: diguanylate cyclase, partial [Candidatus Rokubacteria bacterium]|nr:diguanylate cyclase [Candidatus Rokubacteria bacterium]